MPGFEESVGVDMMPENERVCSCHGRMEVGKMPEMIRKWRVCSFTGVYKGCVVWRRQW